MAELIAALLLLSVSLVWWAVLLLLVVSAVKWIFGEADDLHPRVLRYSRLWVRLSYVQITCFLLWLVLWIGSGVDRLGSS